jgi:Bacterial regulatory proteins, luxR family
MAERLTERERAVLALMAEGRSNAGIATRLYLSPKSVERHVAALFDKLGLPPDSDDNRRVLAVITYSADTSLNLYFRFPLGRSSRLVVCWPASGTAVTPAPAFAVATRRCRRGR